MVWSSLLKAPTKLRYYLCAKNFYLLEHHFLWQPGVIDEEELALVIAHVVRKFQGALNNLFCSAHGQRGVVSKFLQARSVPVHGCVIEVRAEELLGFLFSIANEYLAAEPHDGLVCSAVAIGGKATPVHVDHLGRVFLIPENIIVENPSL